VHVEGCLSSVVEQFMMRRNNALAIGVVDICRFITIDSHIACKMTGGRYFVIRDFRCSSLTLCDPLFAVNPNPEM
jgi:hypothetical protein